MASYLVHPVTRKAVPSRTLAAGVAGQRCIVNQHARVGSTIATTVLLPVAGDAEAVLIEDADGQAATNAITIDGDGVLIDGAATLVLSSNSELAVLVKDGASWNRVTPPRLFTDGAPTVGLTRSTQLPSASGSAIAASIAASAPAGSIPITKVAGAGWTTALDLDFTAQATQAMAANGNYVIGGLTWKRENAVNDRVAMALTNGVGLVIAPDNTNGAYDAATRTAPLVWLALGELAIPGLDWSTQFRVWVQMVEAYAFDSPPGMGTFFGIDSDSLIWSPGWGDIHTNGGDQRSIRAGRRVNSGGGTQNINIGTVVANPANIGRIEIPGLAQPDLNPVMAVDPTTVTWPAVGAAALRPWISFGSFTAASDLQYANSTGVTLATRLGIVLGAWSTTGGGTNYVGTIKKVRVDYKQ